MSPSIDDYEDIHRAFGTSKNVYGELKSLPALRHPVDQSGRPYDAEGSFEEPNIKEKAYNAGQWAKARYSNAPQRTAHFIQRHPYGVGGAGLYGLAAKGSYRGRQTPKKPLYTKKDPKGSSKRLAVGAGGFGTAYGAEIGALRTYNEANAHFREARLANLLGPEFNAAARMSRKDGRRVMYRGASKGALVGGVALASLPLIRGDMHRVPTKQEQNKRNKRKESRALAAAISSGKVKPNEADIKAWKTRRQKYGKKGRR